MRSKRIGSTKLAAYQLSNQLSSRWPTFLASAESGRLVELTVLEGPKALAEARRLQRLAHPNITTVVESGEKPEPYAVIPRIDGQPLSEAMRRVAHEPAARVVLLRALTPAFAALHFAHKLRTDRGDAIGCVHGALSAESVLLSFAGDVKVRGFASFEAAARKQPAAFVAPECERGETPGARSDIYSLGLLLWEVTTGGEISRRCAGSSEVQALLERPDTLLPDDWELATIIRRALRSEPSERYATARQMQCDLERVVARRASEYDYADIIAELYEATRVVSRPPRAAVA